MLKVGGGIWMYGSLYNILSIEKEENEKIRISQFDERVGVLGGASEFIALSHEEIEGWDGYLIPPVK